jgi:hypothetical protein
VTSQSETETENDMKQFLTIGGISVFLACLAISPSVGQQRSAAPSAAAAVSSQRAFLNQYCGNCHNDDDKTGNLSFDQADVDHPGKDPELWEKVTRKLRAGLMPPSGQPRPERTRYDAFRRTLETAIDAAAAQKLNPGVTALHRLNRTEYANAIRDLLSIEVDAATILPADDSSAGLDNIADLLGTSPALIERYVGAASKISRLAIGDTDIAPLSTTYKVRTDLTQDHHIDGLPVGTRGGILIQHNFPVDGEYLFKFSLLKVNFGPQYGGAAKDEQLEMSINGERVLLRDLPSTNYYYINGGGARGGRGGAAQPLEIRLPVKAGPQTIAVTFILRSSAPVDDLVQRFEATTADLQTGVQFGYTTVPHLSGVEILGPYNIVGSGDTPSRSRIFVCKPANATEEAGCARKILTNLAHRAYRRPVTEADLALLMDFYKSGREGGGSFDKGIQMGLRRILADPEFVFRFERDPANLAVGTAHRVTDLELASRLSFFLWSSIPDEELLTVAEQGKLKDPAMLEKQVRRMLKDPRSESLATNFAGQWLFLRKLRTSGPDQLVFPDFDDNLRQAFQKETELFFENIVREDRNVFELLNADYTFANERLAKHYGLPGVYGSDFRRVSLANTPRRGLLGQGSFLTVTSAPNRTSVVSRGAWILENLMGSPPPLPPPNVPPLPENVNAQGVAAVATTVRERMIEHRTNEPCKSCHQLMDPIGLSLENFDGIGRWRTIDSGSKIDASGQLVDGTPLTGADSLRNALLKYPDAFVQTMTEKLLMFATGREAQYYDMPAIRAITRDAGRTDYRFSSIVLGIVNSQPFQMRIKKPVDESKGEAKQ